MDHIITLHDKTGPPYARTATCRPTTAATGEVHLDWMPTQKNSECTLVHTMRHAAAATEEKEPEQAAAQPPRPARLQWTTYSQLAHARTLAEHSIQPYTDVTYVERMLQDWTNYETEVLGRHTRRLDTAPCVTWDSLVPDEDIGALAKVIQNTAPSHTLEDN